MRLARSKAFYKAGFEALNEACLLRGSSRGLLAPRLSKRLAPRFSTNLLALRLPTRLAPSFYEATLSTRLGCYKARSLKGMLSTRLRSLKSLRPEANAHNLRQRH